MFFTALSFSLFRCFYLSLHISPQKTFHKHSKNCVHSGTKAKGTNSKLLLFIQVKKGGGNKMKIFKSKSFCNERLHDFSG